MTITITKKVIIVDIKNSPFDVQSKEYPLTPIILIFMVSIRAKRLVNDYE